MAPWRSECDFKDTIFSLEVVIFRNHMQPLGNKPLPEPIITQMYVTIWRHYATMSWLKQAPPPQIADEISCSGTQGRIQDLKL